MQTAWKRAESHLSGARIVRRTHRTPTFLLERKYQTHHDMILPTMKTLAMSKKIMTDRSPCQTETRTEPESNFAERQNFTYKS